MRSWRSDRRTSDTYPEPVGPLGELGALFNPGMRHEEEEKLSKEMLREEEGTGRKGRLGVDLESGVVVIGTANPAHATAEPAQGSAEPEAAQGSTEPEAPDDDANPPRPGEPHLAQRSTAEVPAGKARRQAQGTSTGDRSADKPVGKARRQPRAK